MISVSQSLYNELVSAPKGAMVYGSWDRATETGTLLEVQHGAQSTWLRAAVACLDIATPHLPIILMRKDNTLVATDDSGSPITLSVYTRQDFFRRTPFSEAEMNHLQGKTVLVVGMGSVGAPLAVALAQAGVGTIVGADPDAFEIHNAMRHALPLEFLGWNKANAMAQYLKTACPSCRFVPIPEDIFGGERRKLRVLLEEYRPAAVVAATDSKSVQHLAQMAAIYANCLYCTVGCYSNAVEGEIFFKLPAAALMPGTANGHACYEMVHPSGQEERAATEYDYSTDTPGRYAGEPALGHLVKHKVYMAAVLLTHALMWDSPGAVEGAATTLRLLRRGAQYFRIGGPSIIPAEDGCETFVELSAPWQVKWVAVGHAQDCPVCSDKTATMIALFPDYSDIEAEMIDDVF